MYFVKHLTKVGVENFTDSGMGIVIQTIGTNSFNCISIYTIVITEEIEKVKLTLKTSSNFYTYSFLQIVRELRGLIEISDE